MNSSGYRPSVRLDDNWQRLAIHPQVDQDLYRPSVNRNLDLTQGGAA